MTTVQALLSVAVLAAVTLFTRAFPFLLFPKGRAVPGYIAYLGGVLPFAVMGMLIVYCLKYTVILEFPYGLPEGISILFIVLVHKWRRNLLLSILTGTALYMFLVQAVFTV